MSSRAKRRHRWESQPIHLEAVGFTIEAAGEDSVPSFSMKAYNGGRLHVSNFRHPVVVEAAGVAIHGGGDSLPILRDHDTKRPIGHGSPSIDTDGLRVEGKISQATEDASDVIQAARNGFPWQASIGGKITKPPEFIKAGQKRNINGRQQVGPLYVVRGFLWTETSVVSVGADADRASTSIAAQAHEREHMSEFDKWLEAKGFQADDLTQEQEDVLRAGFQASQEDPAKKELEELRATQSADQLRKELAEVSTEIRRVNQLAERYSGRVKESVIEPLHAQALSGEISPTQFELELVKSARPLATPSNTPGYQGASADAIVAAMCQTAGLSEDQTAKGLKAEIGDEASQRAMNDAIALRDFNIHKLIYATLAAHGQYAPAGAMVDDTLLRSALQCSAGQSLQASANFSTVSLPGILSRVANKAMLASYQESMGVALTFASQTSTTDFKQFDRYRLTEAGLLDEVGATGEIKSKTLTEEMHQNQVKQHAGIFGITRVMLINDDLGALTQIPTKLGRMAAHTLEQAVITTLVDAPTGATPDNFFYSNSSAKNKPNYAVGADTALDIDSLGQAYKLFLDQVDSDGKPVMIEPSYLLVTNKNAVNAGKLFNDGSYRFTGTDIKETIDNQWRGRYTPLVSPYLGMLGATPSEDQWYLLPAPTDTACINVAFLRGQTGPTIQTSEVDFHQLGVEMRGVFDFGVALWDQRLAVKMKGAA